MTGSTHSQNGLRAADEVLPQPALGLVHAEPGGVGERRPVVRGRHLRLVEPVPELVQAGVERHREVVGLPARREPHVGRAPCCARTGAPTGPAASARCCSRPRAAARRRTAAGRSIGIVAREDAPVLPRRGRRGDERDELLLQRARTAPRSSAVVRPRLVVVEQDVVRVRELAACRRSRRCSGCWSSSTRSSAGAKWLKSDLLARLHPGLLRVRVRRGDLRREVGRHPHGLVVVAREDAVERDVVASPGPPTPPTARAGRAAAPSAGIGQPRVLDALERLELIRPRVRPARRHHRVLVPQQQAADPVEVGDLARAAPSSRARRARSSTCPARRRRRAARPGRRASKCSAR